MMVVRGKLRFGGVRGHGPSAFLVVLLSVMLSGCGGYGEISPKAYQFATAIYSIANLQSLDRLEIISEKITAAHLANELSDREHGWFQEILKDAREGRWETAGKAARRMMEDQVT